MSTKKVKTDSGIPVKEVYNKGDIPADKIKDSEPGILYFSRGIYPKMYQRKALDDASVQWVRQCRGDKRKIQIFVGSRPNRSVFGI